MSKMSEIDLTIKEIFNYIIIIFIVAVIGFLIHAQNYKESTERVDNIEQRLSQQEEYMHQVQADVDNLYRVVE